jgi:hypothetical protein
MSKQTVILSLTADKIITMIQWSLLQLATNKSIHHTNYTSKKNKIISPLEESIKANGGSFDEGIRHLAKSIESNEEMITMIQNLEELHNDKESDNCDEIYDTEKEIFSQFIELTGLHIDCLHCDDMDNFSDKLISILQ